jgi:predicted RND superfamily exporter protein
MALSWRTQCVGSKFFWHETVGNRRSIGVTNTMNRLQALPVKFPKTTLAVALGLTAYFGFYAVQIRFDSSFENLLPSHDPDRAYYEQIRAQFGDEEIGVVGIFAADVFASATMAKIDTLTRGLQAIDGVREVLSPTTALGVEMTDDGLSVGAIARQLPKTTEESAEIRAKILSYPIYLKNVVAADGTAAGITVFFEPMSDEEFLRRGIEDHIRSLVDSMPGPETYAITGMPTIKVNGARFLERDTLTFTPLAVVLVTIVLAIAFRRVRGVLIPLCTVLVAVVWTCGWMALNGKAINLGTLILNPLLIVIGIASGIHLISAYYHEARPGRSSTEVVLHVLDHVSAPILIAGATTLIGFGALVFTPIRAVQEFGLYSVFGITTVLLAGFTVVPALLVLLPVPVRTSASTDAEVGWLAAALQSIGTFSVRHRYAVLAATGVLLALSIWGIFKVEVETDYVAFFQPQSRVRQESDLIATRLAGTQPIVLVVEGSKAGEVRRLETLKAMDELQEFVARQPGVDTALSILDYLRLVRKALQPDLEGVALESQAAVEQLMLFIDPAQMRTVVNADASRAVIMVRTRLSRSVELLDLVNRIESFAQERFPAEVTVRATGMAVLLAKSADDLAWGQVTGIWQELMVLWILLSFMFLSLRVGVLALIPNVVPTVVLFGLMGWWGISLNISTSMIAAIAIGIAIDDTIHLLSTFNEGLRITGSQEKAIVRAMASAGQAAFFISMALAAGFFIVCLSSFRPVMHFGLLSGVTMGVALVVELFLTPALVTTTRIISMWDLMFLKLGPEPHKQIPIFAGLYPFQAKLVVLMGQLRSVAAGDAITRRGEMVPEAYVLLTGTAEVFRGDKGRPIRTLGRGDTVGEMGLVRNQPRSADVIAAEPVEYLVLDDRMLRRLRQRYPRIAATVLYNLTRVLSDRLESTTDALAAAPPSLAPVAEAAVG